MPDISAGSVSVEVVPDARQFPRRVAAQVNPDAAKIGQQFGRLFGAAAEREMANGVREGLDSGGRDTASKGAKQGDTYGGSFARSLKARLEAAFRSLPDIEITADSSGADRELAAIRAQLVELRDKRIGVDIDAATATAEVERLSEHLRLLSQQSPDVQLRVEAGAATAELAKFQTEVNRLDGQTATLNVDADTAAASSQLALLRGEATGAGGSFSGLVAAALLLGPALIPIAAAGAGAMAAIASGALAAAGGVGVLVLALAPVIAAVQAVRSAHDKSAQSARGSTSAHLQMASAMDAVKTAQQGLASAQEDARVARIRAVEQMKAAETSLADAEHEAALDATQDARKVADARRSLADAVRQAAADQAAADRRLVDAERDVAAAQKDVLRAQQALTDARRQAARDAEDLANRVVDGQLDQTAATLAVQQAQEDLNAVIADPTATQLQRQQAQLSYDQARQRLSEQITMNQRLAQEKADSDKAGIDGSKAVTSAQDDLVQALRRLGDAQRAQADAQAAQAEQQRKSARSIADAERAITDAISAGVERQRRDLEQIAQAHQKVADASRDAAEQQRRSAESIASAQQAVVSAQRGVQQASQSAGAAGGAAMDTVRDKLAALSPAGRAFVAFITDTLLPAFSGLSKTAQAGFLPGLQDGLEQLMPLVSQFKGFVGGLADTLGDLAREAGEALTSPFWRQFFEYIGKTAGPLLEQMGRTFGNVLTGIAGFIEAFAPTTKQFGDGILGLSQRFADFGKKAGKNEGLHAFIDYIKTEGPQVVSTIGAIFGAVKDIIGALAPLGPIVLAVVRGFATFVSSLPPAVLTAIALGIAAVAAAVILTNGALALLGANPIVLIVAGIVGALVALGFAFYELYQKNETFRAAVDTAWAFIKTTIADAWEKVIKPTFSAIAGFVTGTLIPAFQTYLLPVLTAVWSGIRTAITVAWAVIRGVFGAVVAFVREVLAPIFLFLWHNVIEPVWTGIRIAIAVASALIKVALGIIEIYIKAVLAPLFTWLWHNVIEPVWNGIKATISSVWEKGIRPVLSALGDFISDHVAPAFQRGVDAIGKAWGGIKDAAKAPVRFVVDTVINSGIIDTFNKVAGFFHVDPVDHVTLPKGFATGGYVSGPGGPREDKIPAMLSNGEFVINAAAVSRIGLSFLDYINGGGSFGGDPGGVGRFANGGLVAATKKWLPSVDPDPYVWGAVGPGAFDCSGLAGEVWARVTEHARNTRYFTTSSDLGQFGFAPGQGMFTLGLNPGEHVVGNLDGLGFEARSTATGIFVGSSATDPARMPQQWYLARLPGSPGGAPDGISLTHPIESFRHLMSGALNVGERFAGNPFGQLALAMPKAIARGAGDFVSDHVPGFADGGLVTKYDNGGYLPPGLTTVLNATGKPEPVFTGEQWSTLRGGGTGVTIHQTNHYPAPEVPSESLTRSLRKVQLFGLIPQGG